VIDGRGPGSDQTPQNGLTFAGSTGANVQVAIDNSGGATNGDILVAQQESHLVDVFSPTGAFLGQLTQYKPGPAAEGSLTNLGLICGVAVDPSGSAYLGDFSNGVHQYKQPVSPHNPLTNADNSANFTSVSNVCTLAAGAGSTAGFVFVNRFLGGLFKVEVATGTSKYEVDTGATTVTVDPGTGRVFIAKGNEVKEYDASGASSATLRSTIVVGSKVTGLAVDKTSGNVYVAREGSNLLEVFSPLVVVPDVTNKPATAITATTATLKGEISAASGGSATCHFQYTTDAAFQADKVIPGHDGFAGASSAPCSPAGPFTGSSTQVVSAAVSALSSETKYWFRLVGENASGQNKASPPLNFETLGKPLITGVTASEVSTSSARITGEINPRGLPTTFTVQYVTEAVFNQSGYLNATETPAKSVGSGPAFVPVSQQLSGLEAGTTYHFRIKASNEAGEATPSADRTFTTFPSSSGLADGRAYEMVSPASKIGEVYPPVPPIGFSGTCNSCTPGFDKLKMPMQARPDGNVVAYEGSPFSGGLASGANEYIAGRGASVWATTALSGPKFQDNEHQGFKAFSTDLSRGILLQITPILSDDAPSFEGVGFANLYLWSTGGTLQPLIEVEPPSRSPGTVSTNKFRVNYAGANAGTQTSLPFSHVIFQANDALTGEEPLIAPEAPPLTANQTNLYEWSDGQLHLVNVLPGNTTASPNAVIGGGLIPAGALSNFNFEHAISADGNRIFWSDASGQVYVREGGTTTIKVNDPGKFLNASADGSKVLLTDGIVYDVDTEAKTDLTSGQGGFEGSLGASEDLARIYFVSTKALTLPSEENANGEHAEEGKRNVYLWEEGSVAAFIGQLPAENPGNGFGPIKAAPINRTAQVTADGRYLAFMSTAKLTGYDNSGCGSSCLEVFDYDATTDSLHCASCNPSGEKPLGQSSLSTLYGLEEFFPQPENLTTDGHGRVFFESQDVLSKQDTNGTIQDVYQWEPNGVGSCTRASGCVSLISSGTSPKDSQFVNSTPSGNDVYFTTRQSLVKSDTDDLMDLYDARVGGGFEESTTAPCAGEGCAAALPPTPSFQAPGSTSFNGPGNPKPAKKCKPNQVKKYGKCVAKHKKKKHDKGKGNKKRAGTKQKGGAK
jgi:hypothetical protein